LLVNSIPVGVNGLTLAAGGVSKFSLLSKKKNIQSISIYAIHNNFKAQETGKRKQNVELLSEKIPTS
jgi:hypothetical protein